MNIVSQILIRFSSNLIGEDHTGINIIVKKKQTKDM